ncbi:hypothetical protein TNCV_4876221 [Trichonephila clavipes]|uniref:Uncharacterized protein n=1 Tax=Trichonephila clavipes TaxID=2585209 RepID=A0A8X6RDR7_TRICX|nr:hypothetical protein TNCV_4876221 [Trichonephila clavipes]
MPRAHQAGFSRRPFAGAGLFESHGPSLALLSNGGAQQHQWRNRPWEPRPTVPNSVYMALGPQLHEQIFRSGGQSDVKLPVSHDLNPIERQWDLLERRVRQHNISSKDMLKRALKDEWEKISAE